MRRGRGGAEKVRAERTPRVRGRERKEDRGNCGGTRGTSPAASNRKGKTPGERELVFGDIAVTGRRRRKQRQQQRRRR